MIIVIGKIEVAAAEDILSIETVLADRMGRTRAEPGNIEYSFAVEVSNPTIMHVIEKWEDQAALDLHLTLQDPEFSAALAKANVTSATVRGYDASGERALR
ncbi:MAG: quinol monooxygenase YgiN [Parvibaculaceae bacterium]|jgi:quinol monooxygenase YgiN|nr:antibiotic biosynthesis monooxygenase [Parvibaculaceae bacterium]